MIIILPVNKKIISKIKKFRLEKKWCKQQELLKNNPRHPSLHLELLEPKRMGIYSIRLDRKFRALLFFRDQNKVEVLNITIHYH